MNTNSNTYTVIYSTILVVIVAAVLAFAATALKGKQEENVKVDTISQILTAAGYLHDTDEAKNVPTDSTDANLSILEIYKKHIENALLVTNDGEPWKDKDLDEETCEILTTSDLKEQMLADDADKELPVYIFENGVTVIPCYGAGLWGPIWGYIGIKDDLTITKACFGHKGETPGLGAKITDMPEVFADKFTGKTITAEILVAKNVTGENDVNAISGATITSTAAGVMVNQWLGFYQGYFGAEEQPCCADCQECGDACCDEAEQCTEACCQTAETAEVSNN